MIRLPLLASLLCLLAAPAHAACAEGGLIDTCLDREDAGQASSGEEAYQRLDGGSFGGRPEGGPEGKVITIGGTTVTLGQTEDAAQPWQPFNREFGDYDSLAREDRPKDPGDPLKKQCHADGCY